MISETLQLTCLETPNNTAFSGFYEELPFSRRLTFEPQRHEYVERDGETYVKFYGPMSSGMEYFIEREKAYNKRISEQEKKRQEEKLQKRGFSNESLGPHYFFPTITTASDEPVNVAEVEPIV